MKKKFFALLLVLALIAVLCSVFVGCNKKKDDQVVFGLITLHDSSSTYDKNFIDAATAVCNEMGVKLIVKSGIDETNQCYETAVDLVDQGCDIIFADSFGHEEFMIKAAKEFPNVQFCHATGTMAHTENLANFHNAFASIYEGRYLAGIAAGMKINEMITADPSRPALMGYVGAYPYAEVVSGLTSFYLGAKSVCPTVQMKTRFTNSWYDVTLENNAAAALISEGCILLSQHADSMGAPSKCQETGTPDVTYNLSTKADCPTTYLIGSKIDWSVYFKLIIDAVKGGTAIPTDWCGGIASGAVKLTELNETVAAAGTADAIAAAKAKFEAGTLKVFDLSTFTVQGATLTNYMADVNTDANFTPDTEVVKTATINGATVKYIAESEFRSAPYFGLWYGPNDTVWGIDGITITL